MYPEAAIALYCLLVVSPFLHAEKMDATMDNMVRRYLEDEQISASEYELVNINLPSRLHKRQIEDRIPVEFEALTEKFDLWLDSTDSTLITDETPVYLARPNRGEIIYEKIPDAMKEVGKLLTDRKHLASVVLGSDDSGKTTINGHLRSRRDNSRLIIRSLPKSIVNEHLRTRRSIGELDNDSADSTYHLVAKLNDHDSKNNFINNFHREIREIHPSTRNTVYPRILVQVDSTYLDKWSNNKMASFLQYIIGFWTDVDVVYHKIVYPQIRMSIAAIIIATHPAATPFIMKEMTDNDAFDFEKALHEEGKFFFKVQDTFPLDSYSVAVTMTKFKLGRGKDYTNLGIAHNGGLCQTYSLREYHCGIAMINDNGEFSGVLTAAHEILHVFGLEHDTAKLAADCSPINGFLMADQRTITAKTSTLSSCSLRALKEIYDNGDLDCMKKPPTMKGKKLPRLASAKIVNLNIQCSAIGKGPSCTPPGVDHKMCGDLYCLSAQGKCVSSKKTVAQGTPCLNAKERKPGFCVKNTCVSL